MNERDFQETYVSHGKEGQNSISALIIGVLNDMRLLVAQEVELAKDEFLEKLLSMKRGVLLLCLAVAILGMSGLLFMIMLVYLLHAVSELPLWTCYAVIGGSMALVGWMLLNSGTRRLREVSLMPNKTIETMKETTIWLGKQTESLKT